MNDREKFIKIMHFEKVNEIPVWENLGFWPETIEKWKNKGLPRDITSESYPELCEYFGLSRIGRPWIPVDIGPIPRFEKEIIEENNDTRIMINEEGVKLKESKKKGSSVPQYLEFPVKNRHDFEKIKERYDWDTKERFAEDFDKKVAEIKKGNWPLRFHMEGFFGQLRNWMGFEALLLAYYDDPELLRDVSDFWAGFYVNMLEKTIERVNIDYATIWEDMAYKNGPMISPQLFREFMTPYYKKITEVLKGKGIDIIFVDTDGNCTELIPLFLEAGVTGMYPFEVQAGMDIVKLRKRYPRLQIIGGLNKRVLIEGDREKIEREILLKVPFLISQGGYIPSLDHAVPPDISLKNYKHYLSILKKVARKKG